MTFLYNFKIPRVYLNVINMLKNFASAKIMVRILHYSIQVSNARQDEK